LGARQRGILAGGKQLDAATTDQKHSAGDEALRSGRGNLELGPAPSVQGERLLLQDGPAVAVRDALHLVFEGACSAGGAVQEADGVKAAADLDLVGHGPTLATGDLLPLGLARQQYGEAAIVNRELDEFELATACEQQENQEQARVKEA